MSDRIAGWGGGAVVALWIIGFAAVFGAIIGFATFDPVGIGVCLAAAALAFGGVANVVFRR